MMPDVTETVAGYSSGAVEALYEDYRGIVQDLSGTSPSALAALNRSYHKHLLVAAASNLEHRVKQLVPDIFTRYGSGPLGSFVMKATMARGYHTLFDWNKEKAHGFFTNFGEACGLHFREELRSDDVLKGQHDAFMQLGNLRNQVVHGDYASHAIALTPEEVIERYRDACRFVARIEHLIFWEVVA